MRLIDADALLYHLADYQLQESPGWGANGYGNADAYEAITECMKAIEDAPTIEERKTGRWLKISPANIFECSLCGKHIMTDDIECFKWCHRCGARMEGET